MYCAMYAKDFAFLFKLMILRKNGAFEKNQSVFCLSLLEKTSTPKKFITYSDPTFYFLKKRIRRRVGVKSNEV